ncbi:PKD domain-containing protein [Natrinema sp. CGMCC1.2065]|uniref:PKD domain-containing protein n=1 Tax=Natrinema sp. CGMCC1.2065 TaxID=3445767 RepID=UPI003F49E488
MSWDRRRILQLAGAVSIPVVAGCNGGEQSNEDGPTGQAEPASPPESQQAKLAADDGDSRDGFGGAVALAADGQTALIGASGEEEPNGQRGGAAYVFTRSDGDWSQQAKLAAEDGAEGDLFGISTALSDDGSTALIGADLVGHGVGAAYVFTQADGEWTQRAKLVADDGDENDKFGRAVALTGDGGTALIGAYGDEDPNGTNRYNDGAGSAYVFARSDGDWSQQAKLAADDGAGGDGFGWSVAIADDAATALVGCLRRDATYVFTGGDGSWEQQTKFATDESDDRTGFGSSLAIDDEGTTALIGAFVDAEPNGEKAGSAYVFTADGDSWTQRAKFAADDGDKNDQFAHSVALSSDGRIALAGADPDADPNGERAGSAYVFTDAGGSWSQQVKLAADDGDKNDRFGLAAALANRGGTALIGAAGDEDPNGDGDLAGGGSAYVFE